MIQRIKFTPARQRLAAHPDGGRLPAAPHRPAAASRRQSQAGFTLVELLLAIAFISFILMFIIFAITQVMGNYNKGVTIREINQLARNATDVMVRDIRNTNIESVNLSAVADRRVCFGDISYVWNVKDESTNKYTDDSTVHFTRVRNPGGSMCVKQSNGEYPNVPVDEGSSEGIENAIIPDWDEQRIWVNNIAVTADTALQLVTVKVVLTTAHENQPAQDPVLGPVCGGDNAGDYCAVGTFETTATTRNGGE